jgi:hypothetical protein
MKPSRNLPPCGRNVLSPFNTPKCVSLERFVTVIYTFNRNDSDISR